MNRMALLIVVSDSLGLPRPFEGVYYKDTYPSLIQEQWKERYNFIHLAKGGGTARELLDITFNAMSYYAHEVVGLICHFGIVDASPRALLPAEIQAIDRILGPSQPLKNIISQHHAEITETRGYPTLTTSEEFQLILKEITRFSTSYGFPIAFLGIAPCAGNMQKQCPSFNQVQRVAYNKVITNAMSGSSSLKYIEPPISEQSSSEMLLTDGHHLSCQGHLQYAKAISGWIEAISLDKGSPDVTKF